MNCPTLLCQLCPTQPPHTSVYLNLNPLVSIMQVQPGAAQAGLPHSALRTSYSPTHTSQSILPSSSPADMHHAVTPAFHNALLATHSSNSMPAQYFASAAS